MTVTIYTGLGAVEYVDVTINADVDISSDTVQIAVGSYTAPGAWRTPDSVTFSNGGKTAVAKLLIGPGHYNPVAGTYYCWYRVVALPTVKIQPIRATRFQTTDIAGVPVVTVPPFVQTVNHVAPDSSGNVTVAGGGSLFGQWIYGDGSDGAHVCTNGEVLTSGSYTDFTIPAGVTVTVPHSQYADPHPVIIRCTGTYTINGTVDLRGGDAAGRLGGGGDHNSDASTGAPAVDGTWPAPFPGGSGGSGAAGAGGVAAVDKRILNPFAALAGTPGIAVYGGAPGAGDGTNYGGAGGGVGKWFLVIAKTLAHGPNNLYDLRGGRGGNAGDDGTGSLGHGNCGGGGGGGGGWWGTISDTIVGTAGVLNTAAPGGTGCGTGTNGQAGTPGGAFHLLNMI